MFFYTELVDLAVLNKCIVCMFVCVCFNIFLVIFLLTFQDYYLHDKHLTYGGSGAQEHLGQHRTYGYDFRFNEQILKGKNCS